MVSALSTYTPAIRAAQGQPQPTPQPPAPPAPPADGIDLSSIDCPYKVAQLPVLEPTFQLGVAVALLASAFGGPQAVTQLVVSNALGQSAEIVSSFKLHVNKDDAHPVQSEGQMTTRNGDAWSEPQAITGNSTMDQQSQSLTWDGQIGSNPEKLTFHMNNQSGALEVNGQVGSIPVGLTFSFPQQQPNNGSFVYKVDGTVADLPYAVENVLTPNPDLQHMPQPGIGQTVQLGTMSSRGHLGQSDISKDYSAKGTLLSKTSLVLSADGQGSNAGRDQKVSTTLTVSGVQLG